MLSAWYFEDQTVKEGEQIVADRLSDGTRVTMRPVQQSDVGLIQAMHTRLSKETLYYRYFAPRAPDPEDLQHLCFLDGGPGLAVVATVQEPHEKVIAMGCYSVDAQDPTTAEPAMLVEDSYQGRGLGKRLWLALCQQARQMGLEVFACFALLENTRVLRLIKECGLRSESRYNQGVDEIRVWLKPEPVNSVAAPRHAVAALS